MALNTLVCWRISHRYGVVSCCCEIHLEVTNKQVFHLFMYFLIHNKESFSLLLFPRAPRYIDLSVQGKALTISPLTEKLHQYKACLRYYDTVDYSYTKASTDSISDTPHCEDQCQWRWHFF